jgi:peptidoglycan hydrolase CwlO-like protein
MSSASCRIPGCLLAPKARGLCNKHYVSARRDGSVEVFTKKNNRILELVNSLLAAEEKIPSLNRENKTLKERVKELEERVDRHDEEHKEYDKKNTEQDERIALLEKEKLALLEYITGLEKEVDRLTSR